MALRTRRWQRKDQSACLMWLVHRKRSSSYGNTHHDAKRDQGFEARPLCEGARGKINHWLGMGKGACAILIMMRREIRDLGPDLYVRVPEEWSIACLMWLWEKEVQVRPYSLWREERSGIWGQISTWGKINLPVSKQGLHGNAKQGWFWRASSNYCLKLSLTCWLHTLSHNSYSQHWVVC